MTRCSLEIVPRPVCPQRVRDGVSCDCSTRRCRRKGEAIASLLQQEVRDAPHAEHRTHPLICHRMLLTQVLDLGVPIMVLLSCTGTLTGIAGGLADGRPGAGEDYAPLAGGFPIRLLPPPYGLRGGPGCHPTPRCDRCHPIAQSGARTLGLRLPETAEVGTPASRLR